MKWERCRRCKQLISEHEEAAYHYRLGYLHLICLSPVERKMLEGPRL